MQRNHSHWARVVVSDASKHFHWRRRAKDRRADVENSLAWMELRTTLAKLLWKYDLQLVDDKLDWHRDSQMHTLWKKPKLLVAVKDRESTEKA
jgi:hypothetical protein